MEFEWDENKRRRNLAKHRIDFEDAIAIWEGDVVQSLSPQSHHGEARFLAYGVVEAALFALCSLIAAKGCGSSAREVQGIMSEKITRRQLRHRK